MAGDRTDATRGGDIRQVRPVRDATMLLAKLGEA
jgi:hypothetical protein